jgi:translation initiation factor 5B
VVGVEVLAGEIKPGVRLLKHGREIGTIKEIQQESVTKEKARKGDRVAVSIDGPTVGRQIREGDELTTAITNNDLNVLEELGLTEEAALAKKLLGKE